MHASAAWPAAQKQIGQTGIPCSTCQRVCTGATALRTASWPSERESTLASPRVERLSVRAPGRGLAKKTLRTGRRAVATCHRAIDGRWAPRPCGRLRQIGMEYGTATRDELRVVRPHLGENHATPPQPLALTRSASRSKRSWRPHDRLPEHRPMCSPTATPAAAVLVSGQVEDPLARAAAPGVKSQPRSHLRPLEEAASAPNVNTLTATPPLSL